ncbi:hypothetical protein LINPERPRIM_LOCUS38028 [Linum perenne]
MTWLREKFAYRDGAIRDDDIDTIHQYCRAYILDFFDSCIFTDRSGAYAHLFFLPLLEDLNRVGEYAWGGGGGRTIIAVQRAWSYCISD